MMKRFSSKASALGCRVLICLVVLGVIAIMWGWLHPVKSSPRVVQPPHDVPATTPLVTLSPSVGRHITPNRHIVKACRQQSGAPFKPVSAELLGVGHYPAVPFPMDTSDGKTKLPVPPDDNPGIFAWVDTDRAARDESQIRLTAHTWSDGSGLGNIMIDNAKVGSLIILRGHTREEVACYRVDDRRKVTVASWASAEQKAEADRVLNRFNGVRPRDDLAIMVCAGKRISVGNYPDRMNLFASRYGVEK